MAQRARKSIVASELSSLGEQTRSGRCLTGLHQTPLREKAGNYMLAYGCLSLC